MSKGTLYTIAIIILVLVIGAGVWVWWWSAKFPAILPEQESATSTESTGAATGTSTAPSRVPAELIVTSPQNGKDVKISSPLTVAGSARGKWYFEGSFPVSIRTSTGKVIGEGSVKAQGDWMTTELVPFNGTITFTPQPAGSRGVLILKIANPSGDPANGQQEISIPVQF